jgi:hypothetical protein
MKKEASKMNPDTSQQSLEAAKEYVDKQIETMKRYGSDPDDFSEEEYNSLVEEIAETIDLK